MGKLKARVALFGLVTFLVGCDHATKAAAKEVLPPGKVMTLLRGVLDLRYTENFDTAFSLTRGWGSPYKPYALTLAAVVITASVIALAYRHRGAATWPQIVAFALIVSGAIGNALDRLARGYVVDFIHLAHWPVFNVADALVVVGTLRFAYLQTKPSIDARTDGG